VRSRVCYKLLGYRTSYCKFCIEDSPWELFAGSSNLSEVVEHVSEVFQYFELLEAESAVVTSNANMSDKMLVQDELSAEAMAAKIAQKLFVMA
jgi:hypothetical protein